MLKTINKKLIETTIKPSLSMILFIEAELEKEKNKWELKLKWKVVWEWKVLPYINYLQYYYTKY